MTRRQAVGWLVLVCLVWGVSFTVTKEALTLVSPLILMGFEFGLASLLLIGGLRALSRYELLGGVVLGLFFWGGYAFQTFGLDGTTPSRSAFITSLGTPLVPVVYFLVYRRAPHLLTIAGVVLGGIGMYLLTLPDAEGGGLNRGDLLTLGCAVMFATQIVAAGHFSRRGEPRHLLTAELATAGALSLLFAPVLETPRLTPTPWFAAALIFLTLSGLWSFYMQFCAPSRC